MDFPEPLFETNVDGKRLCLVCAKKLASRALWAGVKQVVPLCDDCTADWNIYGYLVLRRAKPAALISSIVKYKLRHPFQAPSSMTIWRDVLGFQDWAAKMKKFAKQMSES